jgi:hypothetical protein
MPLYLASYDLLHHKEMADYERLIAELRRLGAQKVLFSDWVLRSQSTAVQIRDHLLQFMHADDRLLVAEISTTNWASWKLLIDINKV